MAYQAKEAHFIVLFGRFVQKEETMEFYYFVRGNKLGIGLIILGITVFLFCILTPVGNSITLLISIILVGFGIGRLLRRNSRVKGLEKRIEQLERKLE